MLIEESVKIRRNNPKSMAKGQLLGFVNILKKWMFINVCYGGLCTIMLKKDLQKVLMLFFIQHIAVFSLSISVFWTRSNKYETYLVACGSASFISYVAMISLNGFNRKTRHHKGFLKPTSGVTRIPANI